MIVTKANTRENLGEFICFSITKANAQTNLQNFIVIVCVQMVMTIGNKIVIVHMFFWGSYGLQLQFWPCPELINITVTALGGIPREPIDHRSRS